jgi:preprotein translocase subunit SecG
MGLGTGSPTWDTVLQIAIAVALLLWIIVLIRHYRGR